MANRVDRDTRRFHIAEAVWRLVLREGVPGASVRAVARESGLSMGSVRHFFHTQDELLTFAMGEVIARARARIAAGAPGRDEAVRTGDPIGAVSELLEQLLPLDDERVIEARIWAGFSASLGDTGMRQIRREADEAIGQVCRDSLDDLAELGLIAADRDLDLETERLWALLDGLTLHLLSEPPYTQPDAAKKILDRQLRDLAEAGRP